MSAAMPYMLVFRTIHILAAIAWGGAVFLLVLFLQPTAKRVGPAAGPFMRGLLADARLVDWLLRIAGLTIVAGGFLYWHDMQLYGGFSDFTDSAFGGTMTFGAICALIALGIGMIGTAPTIRKMLATGGQIAQAGDAPPPELLAQAAALQKRARQLAIGNLIFVSLAAFAMATARYW
jgi:uncharacterized membrane protein